jgi:hypothetical protein
VVNQLIGLRSINCMCWIQTKSSKNQLHGGNSASREERLGELGREFPIPSFLSGSSGSSELESGLSELRVDSVMEGLGELFIQLGESKAIFLSSRTTRRVVHRTRRVG